MLVRFLLVVSCHKANIYGCFDPYFLPCVTSSLVQRDSSLQPVVDLVASLALDKEEVTLLEAIFICRAGEISTWIMRFFILKLYILAPQIKHWIACKIQSKWKRQISTFHIFSNWQIHQNIPQGHQYLDLPLARYQPPQLWQDTQIPCGQTNHPGTVFIGSTSSLAVLFFTPPSTQTCEYATSFAPPGWGAT